MCSFDVKDRGLRAFHKDMMQRLDSRIRRILEWRTVDINAGEMRIDGECVRRDIEKERSEKV